LSNYIIALSEYIVKGKNTFLSILTNYILIFIL
jgi:hypothetical protein